MSHIEFFLFNDTYLLKINPESVEIKSLAIILHFRFPHERCAGLVTRCTFANVAEIILPCIHGFIERLAIRTFRAFKSLPIWFLPPSLFTTRYVLIIVYTLLYTLLFTLTSKGSLLIRSLKLINLLLYIKHTLMRWVNPVSILE